MTPPRIHPGSPPTGTSITTTWDVVPGADRYELQWMQQGQESAGWAVSSNKLSGTAARKKGLDACTGYQFRVRARVQAEGASPGWGAFSPPSEVMSTIEPLHGSFANLLGAELVNQQGETVPIGSVSGKGLVFLYFSAGWCPPCRQFTPMLAEFYQQQRARGKHLEIIFVSSDRDEASFRDYFEGHHGPWLALPHGSSQRMSTSAYFKVEGIPRLMVFSPKTGAIVSENAVGTPLTNFQYDKWERAAHA